jgi:hypothetical protein
MRTAWVATAACLTALGFPASAMAIRCAPPGTSGVDQYYETIPGPNCNAAPPGSGPGSGSGKPGAHNLSPSKVRVLASQGPAGRAVAGFVSSTAPSLPGGEAEAAGRNTGRRGGGHSGRGVTTAPPSASGHLGRGVSAAPPSGHGENPILGALRPIVTGSGTGTGPLLPIVAGAAALLALMTVAVRLRGHRRAPSGEP